MSGKSVATSVKFTSKGQVVIPISLRREFHIENGTRAIVQSTPEGILLKPVSMHAISRLRGVLKTKPGGKSLRDEWPTHVTAEKALEEPKDERRSRRSR